MDNRPEDGDHESRSPLADLYRLGTTYRWQVVHLTKTQTVAEHSYFVTLLFMKFAEVCEVDAIDVLVGLEYALLHDADEAWSGDVPGPLKKFMAIDLPVDKMMGDWASKINKGTLPSLVKDLVKLADIVEAYKYLHKYGDNHHSTFVKDKYELMIEEKLRDLPRQLIIYHNLAEDDVRPIETQIQLVMQIASFTDGKETYIDDYM